MLHWELLVGIFSYNTQRRSSEGMILMTLLNIGMLSFALNHNRHIVIASGKKLSLSSFLRCYALFLFFRFSIFLMT